MPFCVAGGFFFSRRLSFSLLLVFPPYAQRSCQSPPIGAVLFVREGSRSGRPGWEVGHPPPLLAGRTAGLIWAEFLAPAALTNQERSGQAGPLITPTTLPGDGTLGRPRSLDGLDAGQSPPRGPSQPTGQWRVAWAGKRWSRPVQRLGRSQSRAAGLRESSRMGRGWLNSGARARHPRSVVADNSHQLATSALAKLPDRATGWPMPTTPTPPLPGRTHPGEQIACARSPVIPLLAGALSRRIEPGWCHVPQITPG